MNSLRITQQSMQKREVICLLFVYFYLSTTHAGRGLLLPGSPSCTGRPVLSCLWKVAVDTGRKWLPQWPGSGRPHPLPRRCWAAQPFCLHWHVSAAAGKTMTSLRNSVWALGRTPSFQHDVKSCVWREHDRWRGHLKNDYSHDAQI